MNRNTKTSYILRLKKIRVEIKSLRKRLEALVDEEEEVSELLQQCNNELAPIRQLSDDLLREIFVRCLPSQVTFDSTEAPLLLCHVCHHWRALVTDYSVLWTSLKLDLKQSDTRYSLRHELFSSWLRRCKGSQVSLQVIFLLLVGEKRDRPVSSNHFTFLTNPVTHPPLCYFSSQVLYNIPAIIIHSCLPGMFPSLERLVLSFDFEDKPDWDEIGPILAFRNCPLLRRVALSGFCFTSYNEAISIPWRQLTHFLFDDGLDSSFYSTWLPQMNNLLYSHFAMGDENIGASRPGLFDTAPRNRIKPLDNIVSLTISYWSTSSADVRHPNMWWDYDFPNLRTFRLIAFCFEFNVAPEWAGFKLSSFTSKLESMRTLQTLSLCVARLTRDTCKTIFKCFPQLTTLDLGTCDRYWHVLEVLAFIPGRELLPYLKEVAFEVGSDAEYDMVREEGFGPDDIIDAGRLEDMVKSRWRCETKKRLQCVVFYAAQRWRLNEHKPFVKCLRKYGKEGLDVVMNCEAGIGERAIDHHWSQRDKNLRDWPEIDTFFNHLYER